MVRRRNVDFFLGLTMTRQSVFTTFCFTRKWMWVIAIMSKCLCFHLSTLRGYSLNSSSPIVPEKDMCCHTNMFNCTIAQLTNLNMFLFIQLLTVLVIEATLQHDYWWGGGGGYCCLCSFCPPVAAAEEQLSDEEDIQGHCWYWNGLCSLSVTLHAPANDFNLHYKSLRRLAFLWGVNIVNVLAVTHLIKA